MHPLCVRGGVRDAQMCLLFCSSSQGQSMMEVFFCLWMKNAVPVPPSATTPSASASTMGTHIHTRTQATQSDNGTIDLLSWLPSSTNPRAAIIPASVTWPDRVFVRSPPSLLHITPSTASFQHTHTGFQWSFSEWFVPLLAAPEASIIICSHQSGGVAGQTAPHFYPQSFEELPLMTPWITKLLSFF